MKPLVKRLAIPLSNQKTVAKWLVIAIPLSHQKTVAKRLVIAIRLSWQTTPAKSLVMSFVEGPVLTLRLGLGL